MCVYVCVCVCVYVCVYVCIRQLPIIIFIDITIKFYSWKYSIQRLMFDQILLLMITNHVANGLGEESCI